MSKREFSEEEILKIVRMMVGPTNATGDHGEDMDNRVPNVELLGNIAIELMSDLSGIANSWEGRHEHSIKAVGAKARDRINFVEKEILS